MRLVVGLSARTISITMKSGNFYLRGSNPGFRGRHFVVKPLRHGRIVWREWYVCGGVFTSQKSWVRQKSPVFIRCFEFIHMICYDTASLWQCFTIHSLALTWWVVDPRCRTPFDFQTHMSFSGAAKKNIFPYWHHTTPFVFEEALDGAVPIWTRAGFSSAQLSLLEPYELVTSHHEHHGSSPPTFFGVLYSCVWQV